MRVVIDTNLWLSGLMLPTSVPGLLVRAVVAGEIVAVTSEPLLQEIGAALHYPKVRKRIALTDEQLRRFLTELRYVTEVVDIAGVVAEVPKDRRDDFILATFIASGADYLISGDSDLGDLRARFAILTAREFCDQHLR
jgi:putative PIN family toxin of toxin-antitoxin system